MELEEFEALSRREKCEYIELNFIPTHNIGKTKKVMYDNCYNDVVFNVAVRIGKDKTQRLHPAYNSWKCMLRRCYDPKDLSKNPSYIGCYVCDEWKYFSNYLIWWKDNYIEDFQLDKDILYFGNKVYSPETCIFIPQWLNKFVVASDRNRVESKLGVSWDKQCEKYKARCKMGSKKKVKTLGLFDNETDAHNAWLDYKLKMLEDMKEDLDKIDDRLYNSVKFKIKNLV